MFPKRASRLGHGDGDGGIRQGSGIDHGSVYSITVLSMSVFCFKRAGDGVSEDRDSLSELTPVAQGWIVEGE